MTTPNTTHGDMQSQPTDRTPYQPPGTVAFVSTLELIAGARTIDASQQLRLALPSMVKEGQTSPMLYAAGDLSLTKRIGVAVVGSRKVSSDGAARARRLARELANEGVVVVSGLAAGVDVNAHTGAIRAGGKTIAVIGTPLDAAYPAAHKRLQESIYQHHLLLSPFPPGSRVFPSNFPQRNKIMAAITDATVIIEASDTSGTIHQAAECVRLGRWLFIAKSVVDDHRLTWPKQFLGQPKVRELAKTSDILEAIR